jgi:hypothetical protein
MGTPESTPEHEINKDRHKSDLGVINEESMSQSASHYFSKPNIRNESMDDKMLEAKKEFTNLLTPNTMKKGKNLLKYKTKMDQDMDMIEMVTELGNVSSSKKAAKKFDEELSKYSEESKETLGSKNSKIMHSLKNIIKNMGKTATQPLSSTNKASKHSKDESVIKSISSISVHSSINEEAMTKKQDSSYSSSQSIDLNPKKRSKNISSVPKSKFAMISKKAYVRTQSNMISVT